MSLLSALNHQHLAVTASTNTQLIEAIKAARLDASIQHLFTASAQSAGRGQRGRQWQSPNGNVYLSLYLPMSLPLTGLLSLIVGHELALMPVIQEINQLRMQQNLPKIGVKWANDLGFYGNQSVSEETGDGSAITPLIFHKLSGILIEPVWQGGAMLGCVIGVGLNVVTTPLLTTQTREGMSYQAVSLKDLYLNADSQSISAIPALSTLYEQIAQSLLNAHQRFVDIVTAPDTIHEFLTAFAQVDALSGKRMQVTRQIQGSEEVLTGYASGIDCHGCLQLRLDDATLIPLFTGRIDVLTGP